MNRFITRILCAAALVFSAQADSIKTGSITNGVNLLLSTSAALKELTVLNGAAASTFILYDNNSATSTNIVRPLYYTYSRSRATNAYVFTNALGNLQTNSEIYLQITTTTNAATTNEANRVYLANVAASGTLLVDPPQGVYNFTKGVQLYSTSTSTLSYVMTYDPLP